MMGNIVKPSGVLLVKLIRDGRVIQEDIGNNLVVNTGAAYIVDVWQNLVELKDMRYIASGIGGDNPDPSDVSLDTEVANRVSGTVTEHASNIIQIQGTIHYTASFAIVEAGLFNVLNTEMGTMFARRIFGAFNVGNGDALQFTWRITF